MQQNKYCNWVFTWNSDDEEKLPANDLLYKHLESITETFAFQVEVGEETKRLHIQGCFKLIIRKRKDALLREFASVFGQELVLRLRLDKMEGKFEQAVAYCTKEDGRVSDKPFLSPDLYSYSRRDIDRFQNRTTWYPWQNEIFNELFNNSTACITTPHDREIVWITDHVGHSGKSKFCKWICSDCKSAIKIPFGSASQIRSSVIAAGPKQIYFLDVPRTLGDDDSLESVISAIEDIKNGFVTSAMYGKYQHMIFDVPHIVIFSNINCPTGTLSTDRWSKYFINQMNYKLIKM